MFIGQITHAGFRPASTQIGSELKRALGESPAVILERFVEPSLLEAWSKAVESAPFAPRVHKDSAYWGGAPPKDFILTDETLRGRMIFSANDAALLEVVQSAVDEGPIGSFLGVVTRSEASTGARDRWHNDMDGNKVIALSLNLGRAPYCGGHLQMKDTQTEQVVFDAAHTNCGDAILFRLSYDLKHIVAQVEPGPPRTVFTGWFRREPRFADWLRR